MRTRINKIEKVNVGSVTKKEKRQRYMYGQAVQSVMNELSCNWEDGKKELRKRMTALNISREINTLESA